MRKPLRRFAASLILLAALGVGGTGCLPLPPHGVLVVHVGPPPPRWERMGPPPGPAHVWVAGFWIWERGDYVWRPGVWRPAPPGHRYWVPGRWIHTRRGWYYHEGHWD
jgi:hypothetical protein